MSFALTLLQQYHDDLRTVRARTQAVRAAMDTERAEQELDTFALEDLRVSLSEATATLDRALGVLESEYGRMSLT